MTTSTPTRELQELDRKFHLHPFTNHADMQNAGGTNIVRNAEGCYVIDQDGRRLLDVERRQQRSTWSFAHLDPRRSRPTHVLPDGDA